ncbi:MAG: CDP-diacylglycerol--serine O-phosphatidyltransferase, partial [Nitrospinota bacterium]
MRRGIYIVPNLLTTGNFFCGFYAVISVFNGNLFHAATAILIGLIFDGLDGRVARLTNSTSAFGVEYDSLSDIITFGIAPALLVYSWELQPFGRIGWMAAFLFAICGALRLARFNSQDSVSAAPDFTGLPVPVSAGFIASLVILTREALYIESLHPIILVITVYILAFLMVSNIPYRSFKNIEIRQKRPFNLFLFIVLALYIVATLPEVTIFLLLLTYTLSGPAEWLLKSSKP